jgi:nicotinate-nucleotide pyrophosphorylase (carboxylating)
MWVIESSGVRLLLESSGGVTFERLGAIAQTGVDYISVGSPTKNIEAVDTV